MRVLILTATILGILASTNAIKAGPSSAPRELASLDNSAVFDEATLETEDQIGPKCTTAANRARVSHQGQRQVRRIDPGRHRWLARRTRVSQNRLP
jgi:hypothetical protein